MDFFDRQARAQRNTRWLVFYFLLAVLGIIAALQIAFTLILGKPLLDLETLAYVSGGTIAVVVLGSLIKIAELSQGGRVVAAMLGGQPVDINTSDLNERKLVNIVEEMAIASGVPVPEIYLLPDTAINAFAAGHGPGDTAIGVTRGCIEQLSRDELQGVIAHEFSHILHGDMRLNIRLMGLLNGILGLALVGGVMMRIARFMPMGSDSRDKRGGAGALILFFIAGGLALYLIGWIGVFFGKLIKAAVSRQREFLADSSAVQYTRNPDGIAGALWKIGRLSSQLSSPRAEEASHMFFGNGLAESWFAAFATHPPIAERIHAVSPNFDPEKLEALKSPAPAAEGDSAAAGFQPVAQTALSALPDFAAEAARNLHGACALIYALLLDRNEAARTAQLREVQFDDAMRAEVLALFARRAGISAEQEITLAELAIPTLRHLSPQQYAEFRDNIRRLVESDRQINLLEFALQKALLRHLDLYFTRSTGTAVKYKSLLPLLPYVSVLLDGLTTVGQADPSARDAAYAAGVRELMLKPSAFAFPREDGCDLARIDAALDELAQAAPKIKQTVLSACRQAVLHDGKVPTEEYQLLRAIADTLDCPMPALQQEK